MGATTSYISSEFYLQTSEHSSINSILNGHKIPGYLRYVEDILILYNNSFTEHQYNTYTFSCVYWYLRGS